MNLLKRIGCSSALPALLCLGISVNSPSVLADEAPAAASPTPPPAGQVVATVNGKPVTFREFNARYTAVMRERYYHGAPPAGQEEAVRKEVLDLLIENELLVEEAGRRGLKPDEAKLEQAAAAMEARYGAVPEWQKDRERVLSQMKEQIARQSLIEQAKKVLQEAPQPAPSEVRAYYEQKPELFTEPEKLSLSVILLKVDPGAPQADLEKTHEEAKGIYLRLKDGADFAELARQYSGDSSAEGGGNLGYVHGGMLPEKLQNKIDKFQVGVVAEPVRVLEGIAIYRLDERVAPVLRPFTEVEQRAQDLLKRDRQEQVWKDAISRLRGDARIEILLPMASDAGKQDGNPAGATKSDNLPSSGKPEAELTPPASGAEQSDAGEHKDRKKGSRKKKK